jgi:hypothetical protein
MQNFHTQARPARPFAQVPRLRTGEVPCHSMERDNVAILAQRAGLSLSAEELTDLAAAYERTEAQLQALRARLQDVEEPALTFQAEVR